MALSSRPDILIKAIQAALEVDAAVDMAAQKQDTLKTRLDERKQQLRDQREKLQEAKQLEDDAANLRQLNNIGFNKCAVQKEDQAASIREQYEEIPSEEDVIAAVDAEFAETVSQALEGRGEKLYNQIAKPLLNHIATYIEIGTTKPIECDIYQDGTVVPGRKAIQTGTNIGAGLVK